MGVGWRKQTSPVNKNDVSHVRVQKHLSRQDHDADKESEDRKNIVWHVLLPHKARLVQHLGGVGDDPANSGGRGVREIETERERKEEGGREE